MHRGGSIHILKGTPEKFFLILSFCLFTVKLCKKNRESIRDAIAELQIKIIWSNWIPVFKIYQCCVPSINFLALLVHKKMIFKY